MEWTQHSTVASSPAMNLVSIPRCLFSVLHASLLSLPTTPSPPTPTSPYPFGLDLHLFCLTYTSSCPHISMSLLRGCGVARTLLRFTTCSCLRHAHYALRFALLRASADALAIRSRCAFPLHVARHAAGCHANAHICCASGRHSFCGSWRKTAFLLARYLTAPVRFCIA